MDCVFCKIVEGKIPAEKVYEDDSILAFKDIKPATPIHILIIPKIHIPSLAKAQDKNQKLLGKIQLVAVKIAKDLGIEKAFRLVTLSGEGAGQQVFHLHYHLQGGWAKKKK